MDWGNAADRAFNFYFNAVRKGEDFDVAVTRFNEEIAEQAVTAGLEFEIGWEQELSLASLQLMADTLANRLRKLDDEQGYPVDTEFYAAFHSFFSDIIYTRSLDSDENFGAILAFWNEALWSELPTG